MSESATSCFFAKLLYSLTKSTTFFISVEIAIIVGLMSILCIRRNKQHKQLSKEERQNRIDEWEPEPLVGEVPENHPIFNERIVTSTVGKRITVNGHDCLNVGTHNYLGLLNAPDIKEEAIKSIRKYGVGSCGPRGFYGTIDVHLELEERIAKFMEMEETVLYSYGFSTVASAIPAYCKRGDLVFVDEGVNFPIQKGLDAARSKVFYFKHNDANDLERLLKAQDAIDRKNPKKAAKIRRFIIVEAIYMNSGEICPLPEIIELRKQYKLRLILDESISFGSLGKTGRGIIEHFNIDRNEVDLICSSLEHSIGSIGGFCVGSTFIVEHQRLSGLGYCFSASLPPLLAQAAITTLNHFENYSEMFDDLRDCCKKLYQKFVSLTHFSCGGHELSPIKHLYLKNTSFERSVTVQILERFADKCIERKLAVVSAKYLEQAEIHCPQPSIRITANRLFTDSDIDFIFNTIEHVSNELFTS